MIFLEKGGWNGYKKQSYYSKEQEILLQRGTAMRVIKVEKKGWQYHIYAEVISQNVMKFPYDEGYPYSMDAINDLNKK